MKKTKTKKVPETKPKRSPGRPSVFKDEGLQEKYINIWISHFYRKKHIWELEKEYEMSKPGIKNAISFVEKQFVKIPNKTILSGAIFSIKERLKNLTKQLEVEYRREEPSVRNIKELNSEIRSDEIELNKLENIYQEKYSVTLQGDDSIRKILEVLTKKK